MRTFRAMNTDVSVIVPGHEGALEGIYAASVRRLFEDAERRFSRFREDSELSAINRAEGPVRVSREMFELLVRARSYVEATDGLFDPCIGGALVAAGYDRSFAPGELDRDRAAERSDPTTFLAVALDEATQTVSRPPNVTIDLGGLVKGTTVDAASALLPTPSVVDAGGDCAIRCDRDAEGVLVDVEDPRDATRTRMTFRVRDAAVATSAPNRRAWRVGTELRHHLIDPRTGRAAETDLAQVTAIASSAERADVYAKAAFLLGERGARSLLSRTPDVAAVLVRRDGNVLTYGHLEVIDD